MRTISRKEFDAIIKDLERRFGEVNIIENDDGSKTVMIVSRNKHAGTFQIRREVERYLLDEALKKSVKRSMRRYKTMREK